MADHVLFVALIPCILTTLVFFGRVLRNVKFIALSDEDRVRLGLWFFGRARQYGFAFVSQPAQPAVTEE